MPIALVTFVRLRPSCSSARPRAGQASRLRTLPAPDIGVSMSVRLRFNERKAGQAAQADFQIVEGSAK